jgi:hypothetical protein
VSAIRAIVNFFREIFLGCSHGHQTRIFTVKQETYRVCLDCGKHIPHSPVTMRALTARERRRMKEAHAGELKIVPPPISISPALQTVERKSSVA